MITDLLEPHTSPTADKGKSKEESATVAPLLALLALCGCCAWAMSRGDSSVFGRLARSPSLSVLISCGAALQVSPYSGSGKSWARSSLSCRNQDAYSQFSPEQLTAHMTTHEVVRMMLLPISRGLFTTSAEGAVSRLPTLCR